MHTIPLTQFPENLQDILSHLKKGDDIFITKNDKPLARLSAIDQKKVVRKPGGAKGILIIKPDFYEPLEELKEYM